MTVEHKLPMLAVFFGLSALLAGLVARFCGDPLNRSLRRRYAQRHTLSRGPAGDGVQAMD